MRALVLAMMLVVVPVKLLSNDIKDNERIGLLGIDYIMMCAGDSFNSNIVGCRAYVSAVHDSLLMNKKYCYEKSAKVNYDMLIDSYFDGVMKRFPDHNIGEYGHLPAAFLMREIFLEKYKCPSGVVNNYVEYMDTPKSISAFSLKDMCYSYSAVGRQVCKNYFFASVDVMRLRDDVCFEGNKGSKFEDMKELLLRAVSRNSYYGNMDGFSVLFLSFIKKYPCPKNKKNK